MLRTIIALLILIPATIAVGYFVMTHKPLPFESVCKPAHKKFSKKLCSNVGKHAYNINSMDPINKRNYGPILGVTWRTKDSVISPPGQEKRRSPQNAYYYIVGSEKSDYVFLVLTSRVEPN